MKSRLQICVYGTAGAGKSSLLASAARHVYETTGKKTRVVCADLGSSMQYTKLVNQGIVELMFADLWTEISPTVRYERLSEGWWPEDVNTPNSPLQPGQVSEKICPLCEKPTGFKLGAPQGDNCGSCKKSIKGQRLKVVQTITGLEGIGLLGLEGLSVFAENILLSLQNSRPGDKFYVTSVAELTSLVQAANSCLHKLSGGSKKGEDRPTPSSIEIDALRQAVELEKTGEISTTHAGALDHYQKVGLCVKAIRMAAARCPVPVFTTAHEGTWELPPDRIGQVGPVQARGLGTIPAKYLADISKTFDLCAHLVVQPDRTRVLHFEPHPFPNSPIPWTAKASIPGLPPFLALSNPTVKNPWAAIAALIDQATN